MRVIPHRKPEKPVRPPKERKPLRYAVEVFSYPQDDWRVVSEHWFACTAKDIARNLDYLGQKARVVDRQG